MMYGPGTSAVQRPVARVMRPVFCRYFGAMGGGGAAGLVKDIILDTGGNLNWLTVRPACACSLFTVPFLVLFARPHVVLELAHSSHITHHTPYTIHHTPHTTHHSSHITHHTSRLTRSQGGPQHPSSRSARLSVHRQPACAAPVVRQRRQHLRHQRRQRVRSPSASCPLSSPVFCAQRSFPRFF